MEFNKLGNLHFNFAETLSPRLPVLVSPTPHKRTQSISKNTEGRFILSNSIEEDLIKINPRLIYKQHKPRLLKSLNSTPMCDELSIAIKNLTSLKKPKKKKTIVKKYSMLSSMLSRNAEENDIHGFILSMFSHEPSPFRKMGLTSEPEAIDLRAADKILQEAKKIIKHGIVKKNNQQGNITQIEEFWKNQISHEKDVRWDIFEEGLLVFLESFMICNYGALRKLNWKTLLKKLYHKLSVEVNDYFLWPSSPSMPNPPNNTIKIVSYSNFAYFVSSGDLDKTMLASLEELPSYIENLRKGHTYTYSCGCIYKGEWKDGRKEGNGVLDLCTGDSYSGTFNRSYREDYGTFNGDRYLYKGDFKRDKFHGYGKMKFPDRSTYEGLWVKNYFNNGTFDFGEGSTYTGEWVGYSYEGKGVLTLSNGTVKKGMWRNGKLCGEGKIKYSDDTIIKGFFIDDILQSESINSDSVSNNL